METWAFLDAVRFYSSSIIGMQIILMLERSAWDLSDSEWVFRLGCILGKNFQKPNITVSKEPLKTNSWQVSTILNETWDGKPRSCSFGSETWYLSSIPVCSYWPWLNLVSPVVLGDSGSYQLPVKTVTSWFLTTFKRVWMFTSLPLMLCSFYGVRRQ